MSLNDGSFAPMPAASSTDLLGSRDNPRVDRTCCCCSGTSKSNTLMVDENRSKTRLMRLVFSHLAWQQFVALLFVAKAWDVGFYGEPMAMFAPAMFEDSLDVLVQAFAWVGIGQIIGYGRTMIIAAITALGSAIVAGIVANFPTKKIVPVLRSWRFCLITYAGSILFCGLSCFICRDSLHRKGAFSTAWIISTMWLCCCIGTVRNLLDRIYSRDVSRLIGVILLDMYQLLLIEFLFQIFKAAISCKNLRRVASYYPVDILKPPHLDLKKDHGEEV